MSQTDSMTTPQAGATVDAATATRGSNGPNSGKASAPKVALDETQMATLYANFCRVTGTPEELLVDFGMNAQPTAGQGTDRVALNQRIVLNFYTAKRLLAALNMAVQRHESIFGELETNVQKRARPQQTGESQTPNG